MGFSIFVPMKTLALFLFVAIYTTCTGQDYILKTTGDSITKVKVAVIGKDFVFYFSPENKIDSISSFLVSEVKRGADTFKDINSSAVSRVNKVDSDEKYVFSALKGASIQFLIGFGYLASYPYIVGKNITADNYKGLTLVGYIPLFTGALTIGSAANRFRRYESLLIKQLNDK